MKLLALFAAALACPAAFALGNITVTKPADGEFLGRTNSVGFNITNATREVRVRVRAFRILAGNQEELAVNVEDRFTPNSNNQINGNVNLNFAASTPEGRYRIRVTATETGNTYNVPPPINVTVDVKDPAILTQNPINNAFVRGNASGIVRIQADLKEANVEEWRVKINGGDIPGNSGDTDQVNVNWNTTAIVRDGEQSITLSIDDKAGNSFSRDINVTLDRVRPSSNVLTPTNNFNLRSGTNLPVAVEISDQFANSVGVTGIDVVARRLDGTFLARVSRRSINAGNTTTTWIGRLRWADNLPNEFKIVVNATDKAGNRAVVQEVRVKVSR